MHTAEVLEADATEGVDRPTRPSPEDDDAGEPAVPAPVLAARGLGLHSRSTGWVFRGLDLEIAPGELVAVTAAPGGGRTSALLSLAGRFRHTHGAVSGERVGLGLVRGVHEPEPLLTAREHLDERIRLLRRPGLPGPRRRAAHRAEAERRAAALPFPKAAYARDLSPLERHLLMVHLALVGAPGVLAVDDADHHLSPAEQATLADALRDTGLAAVVTARDAAALAPDRIVPLDR